MANHQDQAAFCDKDAPHSTDSLVTLPSAKPEKVKRNHAVLVQWLETHHLNPYPTKAEKHYLACYANMTQRQLNDWFANARRNIKKVGFPMWKAKHTPNLNGGRSRHRSNTPAAVHPGGPVSGVHGMLPGALESKITYQFPTFYPPPATATPTATATAMPPIPTSSYLPAPAAATGGLIPLPLFNRGPVAPAPFPSGMPNPPTPAALYTLYPSHTSGQCSCRYCTSATTSPSVAALSSHPLGTLPILSAGLNHSSLAPGVLKYEKEAPPRFTPLTHITEIAPLPQPILSTGSAATQPSTFTTTITVPSPQPQLQEAQTPPTSETMTPAASQPSPSCSSVRSVTPLEQQQQQQQPPAFPNPSPCPTLPTSSESASIASGYAEHDMCESVITATVPDQDLCAMMYESRRGMKPLFHLPTTNLESLVATSSAPPPPPPMTNGTTSQGNAQLLPPHQWMWNNNIDTATTQPLYESELPELPETPTGPSDSEPTKEEDL